MRKILSGVIAVSMLLSFTSCTPKPSIESERPQGPIRASESPTSEPEHDYGDEQNGAEDNSDENALIYDSTLNQVDKLTDEEITEWLEAAKELSLRQYPSATLEALFGIIGVTRWELSAFRLASEELCNLKYQISGNGMYFVLECTVNTNGGSTIYISQWLINGTSGTSDEYSINPLIESLLDSAYETIRTYQSIGLDPMQDIETSNYIPQKDTKDTDKQARLDPDQKRSLPYTIQVTQDTSMYFGPDCNYGYAGNLSPGTCTIVEEVKGEDGNLWGKLKSGAGWVGLTRVQFLHTGEDVLESTLDNMSPPSAGSNHETSKATPSSSAPANATPVDKAPSAAEVYTTVSAAAGGTSATTNFTDSLDSFYDIQTSDLEDFVLYIPAISTTLEEIFVARVKPGKMDAVKSACQSRLQSLQENAEFYPDTGAYVSEAKLVTSGNWVMLCVVPNASGAVNAFQNSTATKAIFISLPPDVMDKSSVIVRIDVGSDTVYTQTVETARFPISPLVYGKGTEQVSIYIDGSLVEQYSETFS